MTLFNRPHGGRRDLALRVTLVLMVGVLTACTSSPTITQDFTLRMEYVDQARVRVEARVSTLKGDCQSGRVTDPWCTNGENFYVDDIQANVDGWIAEVESDLVANNSLANLPTYDTDLEVALAHAGSFTAWVDEVHAAAPKPTSQGAMGAPSLGEAAPLVVDAAIKIWQQYQAGQTAETQALKTQIETERFPAY